MRVVIVMYYTTIMKLVSCSVGVLTKNSEKTLERALQPFQDFSEIIVCDGGSTDSTLAIAEKFGAKVIEQKSEFKDDEGRLIDYSGPRNQLLDAASNDWIFFIDSDEICPPELISEVISIVNTPEDQLDTFIYAIQRKYIVNGVVIESDAVAYPLIQYRFFHKKHVKRFTKKIHERIRWEDTEKVGVLKNCQHVPIETSTQENKAKRQRYIKLEVAQTPAVTVTQKLRHTWVSAARLTLLCLRLIKSRLLDKGPHAPFSFSVERATYIVSYWWALMKK